MFASFKVLHENLMGELPFIRDLGVRALTRHRIQLGSGRSFKLKVYHRPEAVRASICLLAEILW